MLKKQKLPDREQTGKDWRGTGWGERTVRIWVMATCIQLKNFSN